MRLENLLTSVRQFIPKHKKCFLLSFFCALHISCGKKARYPASDEDSTRTDELVTHNKVLKVSELEPIHRIVASGNSQIVIPPQIDIKVGSPEGRSAYLLFNITENTHQFYCVYQGLGNAFRFEDCYEDVDGDNIEESLGLIPGEKIVQAQGKALELQLTFDETAGSIEAQVQLDITVH